MREFFACLSTIFIFLTSAAQNNGRIYGTLMDTSQKQPLADVTITILQSKDSSLVTFGRSVKNGSFNIQYLPWGNYRMLATHVGYRNFSKYFDINHEKNAIDVGYIAMAKHLCSMRLL